MKMYDLAVYMNAHFHGTALMVKVITTEWRVSNILSHDMIHFYLHRWKMDGEFVYKDGG